MVRGEIMGRIKILACLVALVVMSGCGGGSSSSTNPADPPPTAVTLVGTTNQSVGPAEGTVNAPLQAGGSVVLVYPAAAFAAATPVTLAPAALVSGEWLHFTLTPGLAELRKPVTLTVAPPASIDKTKPLLLRVDTANGPLVLRTKRLADGSLQATLPALISDPVPAGAIATAAPPQLAKDAKGPRLFFASAAAPAPSSAGVVGFVQDCTVLPAVLADAETVFSHSLKSQEILNAIGRVVALKDTCGSADEVLRLSEFTTRAKAEYATALTAWKAVDYAFPAQFDGVFLSFKTGLAKSLAWCGVAKRLDNAFDCPVPADYDPDIAEISQGLENAALDTLDPYLLRVKLVETGDVALMAAAFDFIYIQNGLEAVRANILNKLIERAYALCNTHDLYKFKISMIYGDKSAFTPVMIDADLAYCNVKIDHSASHRLPDGTQGAIAAAAGNLLPGDAYGNRPESLHTFTLPPDAGLLLNIAPTTRATACSRVIGAPFATDESLVFKIGTTELGRARPDANGFYSAGAALLQMNDLVNTATALGLLPVGADAIALDIYRVNASVPGCTDDDGSNYTLIVSDSKLYSLVLKLPGLTVTANFGTSPISLRITEGNGSPSVGATVALSASNAIVDPTSAIADGTGTVSFNLTPNQGASSVNFVANVHSVISGKDVVFSEVRQFIPRLPRFWTGTVRVQDSTIAPTGLLDSTPRSSSMDILYKIAVANLLNPNVAVVTSATGTGILNRNPPSGPESYSNCPPGLINGNDGVKLPMGIRIYSDGGFYSIELGGTAGIDLCGTSNGRPIFETANAFAVLHAPQAFARGRYTLGATHIEGGATVTYNEIHNLSGVSYPGTYTATISWSLDGTD